MVITRSRFGALFAAALLTIDALAGVATIEASSTTEKAHMPRSLSILEFGGPNVLFAADQKQNRIYAFEIENIPDSTRNLDITPYNLVGFGSQLARYLETDPLGVTYHDLAVHPVTKVAFLSITVKTESGPRSELILVTPKGEIRSVDFRKLPFSSVPIGETPDSDVTFWRDIPAAALSVTDFEFDDGILYIAGLSNGEFASTLRHVRYPFEDSVEMTSIEMFHTAHNQNETRAPIRAMSIATVDGRKTLIAAYTCTPLVTIPASDLSDGAHVVGKTIAELGYGNTPLEVLTLTAYNMERQPEEFVLVINREMGANLIQMESLAKAPALNQAFSGLGDTLGAHGTQVPFAGTLQADDQDPQQILLLRRNIDTGDVDLISSMKGVYFRLSDFVSEYTFPDYQYSKSQEGTQKFHNMIKPIEGYADLVIK
ncbi:MAG: hypothetical protein AAF290_00460 [Pseudomonadota bacterium]